MVKLQLKWRDAGMAVALVALLAGQGLGAPPDSPPAAKPLDRTVLPIPSPPFAGVMGPTTGDSRPDWPRTVEAPAHAPNVLLIMSDDVGFGASGTFGGLIPTPNLDALAAHGLRYNNFHTTAMCSPSRAALLTGRNHHAVGMGMLSDLTTGYPGYSGRIPKSAATVAEILRDNGYSTAAFGKDHDTPRPETSVAGPFDQWPTGLGFDYFYGFVAAQTDQWIPTLVRDTVRVPNPPGEVLEKMLADDAISWIHNQKAGAPDKPFFIYYAPASGHAPHQAPADWIQRFHGKFDQGWDKVRDEIFLRQKTRVIIPADAVNTPRPDMVPAWDSLTPDEKRFAAREMEVYAAYVAYEDDQIGRIIDELKRMGQLDNSLVIFVEGDNGASAEGGKLGTSNDTGKLANFPQETDDWMVQDMDRLGGPEAHSHYSIGWAWAMNTPLRLFKRYASHLGGIRNGMVVSWPEGIRDHGTIRPQFEHLIDVVPTILDAVGVPQPKMVGGVAQQRMDGTSMVGTFASATAPANHHVQYFELLGNRGIYQDGWMASTTPPEAAMVQTVHNDKPVSPLDYKWELYDLNHDFSQSHDLAATDPAKLKSMEDLWWSEAKKNNVLPIDNTLSDTRHMADLVAHGNTRAHYVYWGADVSLPAGTEPPLTHHSFTLTADVDVPSSGGSGVLAAYGDSFGGWSFYLKDGRPVVHEAFSEQKKDQYDLRGDHALAAGRHAVAYDVSYAPDRKGADVAIKVDGQNVASGHFAQTINIVGTITETFDIGRDLGRTVTADYAGDGAFDGRIEKVTVDLHDLAGKAQQADPSPD